MRRRSVPPPRRHVFQARSRGTVTGDTLAPKGTPVLVPAPPVPEAVHWVAVSAVDAADEDKLATALHRLVEDDPALVIRRGGALELFELSHPALTPV